MVANSKLKHAINPHTHGLICPANRQAGGQSIMDVGVNKNLNIATDSLFSFKHFLKENWLFILFLTGLVIVSYVNSLNNAFTSDDILGIANNADLGNFKFVFSSPLGFPQRLAYYFAFQLGGLNPAFFRMSNILFHLGTTLAAFLLLTLMAPRRLAIIAAALFAVHPILTESVTWISGSPYSQHGFLFLLFFTFYILSKQKPKFYYISLFFFLLSISVLSRSFVMLGVIFLYEWFFGSLKKAWKKMLPLFLFGGVVAIFMLSQITYRLTSLKEIYYMQPGTDSLLTKIPTSLFRYFQLIFWPDKLTLYQTEMFFTSWEYGLAVLVFLIYIGSIIYFYYKKNKLLSFWLIFFIVPLLPTLTPLRIAWSVAERYNYVGYLGIFVVVAYAFYQLLELKNIRITVYFILVIILFSLSLRTIIRNQDWQSEESLWLATAKVSPSGPNIHNNLGVIYQKRGEVERAIEEFKLAVIINPAYADAYFNLGNMYYQTQQWENTVQSYQKAVELNPNLWQAHQNLAALYSSQGWLDLAKTELQKALAINPNDPNLQQGMSLIEQGR